MVMVTCSSEAPESSPASNPTVILNGPLLNGDICNGISDADLTPRPLINNGHYSGMKGRSLRGRGTFQQHSVGIGRGHSGGSHRFNHTKGIDPRNKDFAVTPETYDLDFPCVASQKSFPSASLKISQNTMLSSTDNLSDESLGNRWARPFILNCTPHDNMTDSQIVNKGTLISSGDFNPIAQPSDATKTLAIKSLQPNLGLDVEGGESFDSQMLLSSSTSQADSNNGASNDTSKTASSSLFNNFRSKKSKKWVPLVIERPSFREEHFSSASSPNHQPFLSKNHYRASNNRTSNSLNNPGPKKGTNPVSSDISQLVDTKSSEESEKKHEDENSRELCSNDETISSNKLKAATVFSSERHYSRPVLNTSSVPRSARHNATSRDESISGGSVGEDRKDGFGMNKKWRFYSTGNDGTNFNGKKRYSSHYFAAAHYPPPTLIYSQTPPAYASYFGTTSPLYATHNHPTGPVQFPFPPPRFQYYYYYHHPNRSPTPVLGPVRPSGLDHISRHAAGGGLLLTSPSHSFHLRPAPPPHQYPYDNEAFASTTTLPLRLLTPTVITPSVLSSPPPSSPLPGTPSQYAVFKVPLVAQIQTQIEYYFSEENLQKDFFLRANMDALGFIPLSLFVNFHRVKRLTLDTKLIKQALEMSPKLELCLSSTEYKVRTINNPTQWPLYNTSQHQDTPIVKEQPISISKVLIPSPSPIGNIKSLKTSRNKFKMITQRRWSSLPLNYNTLCLDDVNLVKLFVKCLSNNSSPAPPIHFSTNYFCKYFRNRSWSVPDLRSTSNNPIWSQCLDITCNKDDENSKLDLDLLAKDLTVILPSPTLKQFFEAGHINILNYCPVFRKLLSQMNDFNPLQNMSPVRVFRRLMRVLELAVFPKPVRISKLNGATDNYAAISLNQTNDDLQHIPLGRSSSDSFILCSSNKLSHRLLSRTPLLPPLNDALISNYSFAGLFSWDITSSKLDSSSNSRKPGGKDDIFGCQVGLAQFLNMKQFEDLCFHSSSSSGGDLDRNDWIRFWVQFILSNIYSQQSTPTIINEIMWNHLMKYAMDKFNHFSDASLCRPENLEKSLKKFIVDCVNNRKLLFANIKQQYTES
ncbi:uncharacterized protein LOC135922036 isoform X2 [Gordionus sp. m RMFG-2023]|uniref:uncharacterized protein LOC135922036 isoform X2 n=1 Tax=Gordionus sp. m RMFG-2023 TaxID=3053472 RepID=UPI0031FC40B4